MIGDPQARSRREGPEIIIEAGPAGCKDYPSYAKTTEAFGLRYLLAPHLRTQAAKPKLPKAQHATYLANARKLLHKVEATENEYTDRARQLKFGVIKEQGGFGKPIESLTTFEDCFVRAQYEIYQMGQDAKTIKDDKELEAKCKDRGTKIMQALALGLKKPDAQKPSLDVNSAKAILTFYYLGAGKYADAIEVGEGFARSTRAPPRRAWLPCTPCKPTPRRSWKKSGRGRTSRIAGRACSTSPGT